MWSLFYVICWEIKHFIVFTSIQIQIMLSNNIIPGVENCPLRQVLATHEGDKRYNEIGCLTVWHTICIMSTGYRNFLNITIISVLCFYFQSSFHTSTRMTLFFKELHISRPGGIYTCLFIQGLSICNSNNSPIMLI